MADKIEVEVFVTHPAAQYERERAIATMKLLALLAVGLICYEIFEAIIHWPEYPAPYKYVLAFYAYTIVLPLYSFVMVWSWLQNLRLTPFVNINFIISLIGIVIYSIGFFTVASVVMKKLADIGIKKELIIALLIMPIILLVLWLIVSGIFSWIFATY